MALLVASSAPSEKRVIVSLAGKTSDPEFSDRISNIRVARRKREKFEPESSGYQDAVREEAEALAALHAKFLEFKLGTRFCIKYRSPHGEALYEGPVRLDGARFFPTAGENMDTPIPISSIQQILICR